MKNTNVNPDELLVNAHEHQSDVVYVNSFSAITVGELNSLCLCEPLLKYGVLLVDLVCVNADLFEPFLEAFVTYIQGKCSSLLVQHVGLTSAKISLVYSYRVSSLLYEIRKFKSFNPEFSDKVFVIIY